TPPPPPHSLFFFPNPCPAAPSHQTPSRSQSTPLPRPSGKTPHRDTPIRAAPPAHIPSSSFPPRGKAPSSSKPQTIPQHLSAPPPCARNRKSTHPPASH